MKRLICFFSGHNPIIAYWETKDKMFYGNSCCLRCGCQLGIPKLTKKNIDLNFPMPEIKGKYIHTISTK